MSKGVHSAKALSEDSAKDLHSEAGKEKYRGRKRLYCANDSSHVDLLSEANKEKYQVIAQLEYGEILNRVDPLRQELKALEEAAVITKNKDSRMHEQITTLTTMDKLHRALTGHGFDINHGATIRVWEAGPQPSIGDQMKAGDQMNGQTTAATHGARAGTS